MNAPAWDEAGFLMNQVGLRYGNLSAHMAKLEQAGYVLVEKSFVGKRPYTLFHLTDAGRTAFQQYRQAMQQMLAALPE